MKVLKQLLIFMAIGILVVLVTATALAGAEPVAPKCRQSCGDLKVPYPFGIGDKYCSFGLEDKFRIKCDETSQPPKAFLWNTTIAVTNISIDDGELEITYRIAQDCYDDDGNRITNDSWPAEIQLSNYTISSTKNKFVAIGCDTRAFVQANRVEERYATGCISFCEDYKNLNEACTGAGCCESYRLRSQKHHRPGV